MSQVEGGGFAPLPAALISLKISSFLVTKSWILTSIFSSFCFSFSGLCLSKGSLAFFSLSPLSFFFSLSLVPFSSPSAPFPSLSLFFSFSFFSFVSRHASLLPSLPFLGAIQLLFLVTFPENKKTTKMLI
ncbi:hypothetical protein Leryth_022450 [Lithospermum erythrorhizon]|nr:hypothetical protein Leryth_022450 [Lithospermum erythrorhizon]